MNSTPRSLVAALLAVAFAVVLPAAEFTVPDGTAYLADCAFAGCGRLTSISIPASVLSIGTNAFYRCDALTALSVDSCNSVYASQDGVLYSKNLLTLIRCPGGRTGEFTVPEGVRYISERAFAGCAKLTEVTLPASIITLGYNAFYHCDALTNIAIAAGSTLFRTDGGVLYDSSRQPTLLRCPGGKSGAFVVPEGTWYLADGAFAGCARLTEITLPASLAGIGTNAFYHCDALTNISVASGNLFYRSEDGVLYDTSRHPALLRCPGGKSGAFVVPEGTWYLADRAFAGCRRLTEVTLPASLVNVGTNTFYQCDALTDITADDDNSFYGSIDGVLYLASRQVHLVCCPGGKSGAFVVPSGVLYIDAGAFAGCSRLTEVSIPVSVLGVGTNAFYRCDALTNIVSASPIYTSSGGLLYSSSRLPTLLRCPGGKSAVAVPEGTWMIASRAFAHCARLTTVSLPSNTFTLGAEAFYRCPALASITVDAANVGYVSVNGVIYTHSPLSTLVCCPGGWGGIDSVSIGGVSVPYAWLDRYGLASGGDYASAAASDADGDGYSTWQEYVAGTDPTDALSRFLAIIAVTNGTRHISYVPALSNRAYAVEGKAAFPDAWSASTNAASRFFRVTVGMPD